MAITQGTVKLKIVMNRGAAGTPVFAFTDQSNYDDFSVVKGALKIEYGSTVYYDNLSNIDLSPDINGGSVGQANEALTRANTIATPVDLPVTASGEVVSGQYKFTYSVKEGAGATITNIVVVDATFSSVNGNMTSVVDLTPTAPSITVTDTTNYVVQNVTPTGTPQITLYYPADAAATPTVVNASQLVANAFYTGEQIAKLSSTKTWDYSNKLISSTFTSCYFTLLISDLVTDRLQINVEADNNLCAIFCCLKDFAAKVLAAKSNPTTYKHYVDIAGQVAFFYNSIASAYECSKTENVNLWIEEIRNLVGCTDDCECTDGAPILITAIPEVVTASLTVTDGVNTVTSANTLTFSGATVSGSGGDATITIEGGGGSGTVTEVTANAPLSVATGTTTPDLTIAQATTSTDGYLSSTDWNTFNNKGVGTISGTGTVDYLTFWDGASQIKTITGFRRENITAGPGIKVGEKLYLSENAYLIAGYTGATPNGFLDVQGEDTVRLLGSAATVSVGSNVVIDGLNWPTSDGTSGQVLTTDGATNLSWASPQPLAFKSLIAGPYEILDSDINTRFFLSTSDPLNLDFSVQENWPEGTEIEFIINATTTTITTSGTGTVTFIGFGLGLGGTNTLNLSGEYSVHRIVKVNNVTSVWHYVNLG
jgi:hypothetical protein